MKIRWNIQNNLISEVAQSSREIIEQIIWRYKDTLNVTKVVDEFIPQLETIRNPKVIYHLDDKWDNKLDSISIDEIFKTACEVFGYSTEKVLAKHRRGGDRNLAHPRHATAYFACKVCGHGLCDAGRYLNGRDHSTIISGIASHQGLMLTDDKYQDKFAKMVEKLAKIETIECLIPISN